MDTFIVESEGAPVVPVQGKVKMDVNVRASFVNDVVSGHAFGSPEFDAQFASYMDLFEKDYKELPFFSVQDANHNRNRTFSFEETGTMGEGVTRYNLTIAFDIVGAEAQFDQSISTDLTGQDKIDFLNQFAASWAANYKASVGWTDL